MIILLWLLFLIVPFLVGIACFKINKSSLSEVYVNGTLLCILFIEGIHIMGLLTNRSIYTIAQGTLLLFGIIIVLSISISLGKLRKNKSLFKLKAMEPLNSVWLPFLFFILILIQVLTIYSIRLMEVP